MNTASITLTAGLFLALTSIPLWGRLIMGQKVFRVSFAALLMVSAIARLFIYHAGKEPAPVWFAPTVDYLMVVSALAASWVAWKRKQG